MSEEIVIDLSNYDPEEKLSPDLQELAPRPTPEESLGFVLTPMDAWKSQQKGDVGVPEAPMLTGYLSGHGVSTIPSHVLRWQSENDLLQMGGVAAPLSQEKIEDDWEDLTKRPTMLLQVGALNFTESPDLRIIIEVRSHSRTLSDSWIQFFLGKEMIAKQFIGDRNKDYQQTFRFTGLRQPNQYFSLFTRLATEQENVSYFLFKAAQVRVYEPHTKGD